jgi:hypothetical protein
MTETIISTETTSIDNKSEHYDSGKYVDSPANKTGVISKRISHHNFEGKWYTGDDVIVVNYDHRLAYDRSIRKRIKELLSE